MAKSFCRLLEVGDVIGIEGELGSGKTVFVKGIALALGYDGSVLSPTFTIIRCYPDISLCHVDAFRLSCPADLLSVGIEEFLDGEWICAIEWAEKVSDVLPDDFFSVRIGFGKNENERNIFIGGKKLNRNIVINS